jgi:glutamine synthetase
MSDKGKASEREVRFGVPDGFEADPTRVAEIKKKLLDAGVRSCFATFVDVHGIPKAKATPIQAFEKMCNGQELYTVGANEGLGLAGPHEDECATIPDLDSMVILPWDSSQAWFNADLYYHGAPYQNDPRGILRRVMARAESMGFRFNLGIEPELYVLKQNDEGKYVPITQTEFKGPNACYDVNLTTESMAFLEPMTRYMNELGWGLFSFDQECGRGQHELDFNYADALTMADRFGFLRFMAKKVAQSIGAVVTYMPKPFAGDFRSGAHFNMSLAAVETGENLFTLDSGSGNKLSSIHDVPMSDLAYHFTAGILNHAASLTAVTCPTYNSYQGLLAQGDLADFSWAPVLVVWGKNNRSAMLRFPLNRYCLENRAVDMSCNPYLCAAFHLAAGLDGIEQKADPGTPINRDVYRMRRRDLKEAGIETLPPTLLHALEAFEIDPLVDEVFGSEFKEIYITQKLREWDRSFFHVSDEQRELMLTYL